MVYSTGKLYKPTRKGWRKQWMTRTPLRTSAKSGNYGLSPHNTLPARSVHSDRSPGRTTSNNQYLYPYSTPWTSRDSCSGRTTWSSRSTERHTPRITFSKSKRDSSSSRPLSYLGLPSSQDEYNRSPSPNYRYSHYNYLQDRSTDYRSRVDSPNFRPKSYSSSNTVWTDLSMRYPKTPKYVSKVPESYSKNYRSDNAYSPRYAFGDPTAPDLSGWRARLARQGYVASTQRKKIVLVPDRLWQYLDEDELEEPEEGFEYLTSRSTCEESEEKQNSVISRRKRMKLQVMKEKLLTTDAEIQVEVDDFQKYLEQEEKRQKRTFISSRHRSWYGDSAVSYNKYLSPMPWRGSNNYSRQRWSRRDSAEDTPATESQTTVQQVETPNKDFRKSVLNMDLPEEEAEAFSRKQVGIRYRRTTLEGCSDDNSPSETGYESHSSYTDVDADRSSGEAESIFTDSMDRSFSELRGPYKSSRSTPFGDDLLSLEGTDSRMSCLTDSQVPLAIFSPDPDIINLTESDIQCYRESSQDLMGNIIESHTMQDLCFRFKTLNETASQRDSGFSELYTISDSPHESLNMESDMEAPIEESVQHIICNEQRYIGQFKDIDEILMDNDLDGGAFETFEDFERRISCQKSNIRTKQATDVTPSRWSKPSKVGLRLDLSKNKFIGTCTDIDEMLGKPTPITPDDQLKWSIGTIAEETATDDDDGTSTVATSIIGSTDIADLSCFNEYEHRKFRERFNCPEIWGQEYQHPDKVRFELVNNNILVIHKLWLTVIIFSDM